MISQTLQVGLVSSLFFLQNAYAFDLNGMLNDVIDKTSDIIINSTTESNNSRSEPTQEQQPVYTPPPSNHHTKTYQTENDSAKQPPKYDKLLVADIQKKLNEQGYSAGKADGIFGNRTRSEIKKFQRQNNLTADGIPTYALFTHIENSEKNLSKEVISQEKIIHDSHQKVSNNKPIDLNIKGIKLGLNYEEAKSVLSGVTNGMIREYVRSDSSSFSTNSAKIKYNASIFSQASSGSGGAFDRYSLVFTPYPNESNLVVISRNVSYKEGKSPSTEGFTKALSSKYGKPSGNYLNGSINLMVWVYDKNNKQIFFNKSKPLNQYCMYAAGRVSGNYVGYDEYLHYTEYKNKGRKTTLCHDWKVLSAAFKVRENGSGGFVISLTDHLLAGKASRKTIAYLKKTEKENERLIKQKMDANVPSL